MLNQPWEGERFRNISPALGLVPQPPPCGCELPRFDILFWQEVPGTLCSLHLAQYIFSGLNQWAIVDRILSALRDERGEYDS